MNHFNRFRSLCSERDNAWFRTDRQGPKARVAMSRRIASEPRWYLAARFALVGGDSGQAQEAREEGAQAPAVRAAVQRDLVAGAVDRGLDPPALEEAD
jgi:hypothetical protein